MPACDGDALGLGCGCGQCRGSVASDCGGSVAWALAKHRLATGGISTCMCRSCRSGARGQDMKCRATEGQINDVHGALECSIATELSYGYRQPTGRVYSVCTHADAGCSAATYPHQRNLAKPWWRPCRLRMFLRTRIGTRWTPRFLGRRLPIRGPSPRSLVTGQLQRGSQHQRLWKPQGRFSKPCA